MSSISKTTIIMNITNTNKTMMNDYSLKLEWYYDKSFATNQHEFKRDTEFVEILVYNDALISQKFGDFT